MSGGVDSSVAAALLAEAGHEVIGLSMQLYDQRDGESGYGSCCSLDDLHDAGRVARRLNIPHYIVNFEREFQRTVVSNFVDEYVAGRTPIPCAHCNSDLKFATLLDRSMAYGAEVVATGHYARIGIDPETWTSRAAPRPRCREGSDVFSLLAHAGAAVARELPRRRPVEGRGSRCRASPGSAGGREARQPGDLLRARWRLRGLHRAQNRRSGKRRRHRHSVGRGGGTAWRRAPLYRRPAQGAWHRRCRADVCLTTAARGKNCRRRADDPSSSARA